MKIDTALLTTTKRNSIYNKSNDFFETKKETIDILYNNYFKHKKDFSNSLVMDFSCGGYAILNRLKELDNSISLFGSDIYKHFDSINIKDMFESEDNIKDIDINSIHIVMNPPFNLLTKTIEYFLKLKLKYPKIKSISLLYSLRSLEGITRHNILKEYGYPSIILNMTKRQSFNTYWIR